jgi:hypothetical protein
MNYVLYIPNMQMNFLSLGQIRQKSHFVHIFGGKVETRKDFDKMIVTIGLEDGRLLMLKEISTHGQNFARLSHKNKGIIPSSIMWHSIFCHINYEIFHVLKRNGVSGFLRFLGN